MRVFLLVLLAGSILTSGGSYWVAEQRMRKDLSKIHDRGISTELETADRATYADALEYWDSLPEQTKQDFHRHILIRTSSVASSPQALTLLADHEELLTHLKKASKSDRIEWSGESDAITPDQLAQFLAARVIVDSAKGDYENALAWLSVLKKYTIDLRSLGGTLGYATSLLSEGALEKTVYIVSKRDPRLGRMMLAELENMPDFDTSTMLRQDVAASIASCQSAEWREYAHEWVGMPEQIPLPVAQALTSNRAVRRATEHKLVSAWAQVVDVIGQGHEAELDAMKSMQKQLEQDRSFSGRIAALRWSLIVYPLENDKHFETEREKTLAKIRALLK